MRDRRIGCHSGTASDMRECCVGSDSITVVRFHTVRHRRRPTEATAAATRICTAPTAAKPVMPTDAENAALLWSWVGAGVGFGVVVGVGAGTLEIVGFVVATEVTVIFAAGAAPAGKAAL